MTTPSCRASLLRLLPLLPFYDHFRSRKRLVTPNMCMQPLSLLPFLLSTFPLDSRLLLVFLLNALLRLSGVCFFFLRGIWVSFRTFVLRVLFSVSNFLSTSRVSSLLFFCLPLFYFQRLESLFLPSFLIFIMVLLLGYVSLLLKSFDLVSVWPVDPWSTVLNFFSVLCFAFSLIPSIFLSVTHVSYYKDFLSCLFGLFCLNLS